MPGACAGTLRRTVHGRMLVHVAPTAAIGTSASRDGPLASTDYGGGSSSFMAMNRKSAILGKSRPGCRQINGPVYGGLLVRKAGTLRSLHVAFCIMRQGM